MAKAVAATPSVELHHLLPCPPIGHIQARRLPLPGLTAAPPAHPPLRCPLLAHWLSPSPRALQPEHTGTSSRTYTRTPHDTHCHLISHRATHTVQRLPTHPRPLTWTPTSPHTCTPLHPHLLSHRLIHKRDTHTLPDTHPHHFLTCKRARTHFQSLPHTVALLPPSLTNTPSAKTVALLQSSP